MKMKKKTATCRNNVNMFPSVKLIGKTTVLMITHAVALIQMNVTLKENVLTLKNVRLQGMF